MIGRRIRERAALMLHELETFGGLEVVLIGAPEPKHNGHKIRAVANQNPLWYRRFTNQFCVTYKKQIRPRPQFIDKRKGVIPALRKIAAGKPSGVYCDRLLDFIRRELKNESSRRRYAARSARSEARGEPAENIPF